MGAESRNRREQTRQDLSKLADAEARLIAKAGLTADAIPSFEAVAPETVPALLAQEADLLTRFDEIRIRIEQIQAAEQSERRRLAENERLLREKEHAKKMRTLLILAVVAALIVIVLIAWFIAGK